MNVICYIISVSEDTTMSLSRREIDDLKGLLDTTVQKLLGFSESTLVSAALNCLDRGYDKHKMLGMSVFMG